jgi:hypothetical protein
LPRRSGHRRRIAAALGCARRFALGHSPPLRDQVDEDAEGGEDDDEDQPERFGSAGDVVSAEDVREALEPIRETSASA